MRITVSSETSTMSYQPNKNDVLLGRAANVFHHPGNRRYRHIVALNLRRYKDAKTRLDKMVLIRQVTEQVLDHGRVKFLRRDGRSGEWTEVPFRTAQDKVSHALRDGINKPIFAPLMASEDGSEEPPIGLPGAAEDGQSASQHVARLDLQLPTERGGFDPASSLSRAMRASHEEQLRQIVDERNSLASRPMAALLPTVAQRLGSMSAASAATRAALGSFAIPHARSTSAPHLLPGSAAAHAAMMDSRRASLPPAQRFVPPPLGFAGMSVGIPLNTAPHNANLPLHLRVQQQQSKTLGHNAYSELLALKERAQLANQYQLADTLMRRQLLTAQQQRQPPSKTFLDDVVQQYRRAAPEGEPAKDRPKRKKREQSGDGNASPKAS